ncbi:unnamed protein product [Anisakis simplex]|uniref:Uncharacterized protein n=1 Tax=Anisakis simplex TaxID=6269 RepID=A0A0M3KJS7_ANISI|nr:unnamed protein product [Anisakis simplex]
MGGYGVTMKNAKVYHKPYIMFSTTHLLQPLAWELALGRSFITRPPPWMPDMDDMHFDVTDYRQRWHVLYAKILAWLSLKFRVEFAKNKGLAMVGIEHFTFADLWGNAAFNFQEEIDYMAFPLPGLLLDREPLYWLHNENLVLNKFAQTVGAVTLKK